MQVRKVGFKDEEIAITWENRPFEKSKTTVSHELSSTDAPSPEFRGAMDVSGLNLGFDEAEAYWVADYLMNSSVSLGEVAVK